MVESTPTTFRTSGLPCLLHESEPSDARQTTRHQVGKSETKGAAAVTLCVCGKHALPQRGYCCIACAIDDKSTTYSMREAMERSSGGLEADLMFLRDCVPQGSQADDNGQCNSIVLVATGSTCPPHRGHIRMLISACQVLPPNMPITGIIMVPSGDDYVQMKVAENKLMGTEKLLGSLPFMLRKQLLTTMAREMGLDRWLHISDAEFTGRAFYLENMQVLTDGMTCNGIEPRPKLVFVTGSDRPTPLRRTVMGQDGAVIVPRDDCEQTELRTDPVKFPVELRSDRLRVVSEPLSGGDSSLSSTRLRNAIMSVLGTNSASEDTITEAALEFMTPCAAAILAKAIVEKSLSAAPDRKN